MKILLIITPYHPSQTPNTLRWIPIIEYYESKGIETTVLTTKNRGSHNSKRTLSSKVYEAGYNTLLDWFYFTLNIKRRRHLPSGSNNLSKPSFFSKMMEWFIDKTWRKTYWPDGSQLFYKPGLKKAQEITKNDDQITHVISVGLPFTCHLIAGKLKEAFPYLHWHQDIEDPFSYSEEFWVNNFNRYRKKNIEAERKAFELSDSISVTNPRAKSIYDDLFPEQAYKQSVIYPMSSEFKAAKTIELDSDKINIAYFGSFYEKVRSPEPLLKLLERLRKDNLREFKKLHFHFFGQQNRFSLPIFKSYESLKDQITLHGLKDRDYSMSAMSKMDFLINIGNTTDYHLPSKVVDFLYHNKPVINILSIKNDAAIPLFEDKIETCNLLVNENDEGQLSEKLLLFINKKRRPSESSDKNISDYTTEVIAEQYLKAMQAVQ
ncbi:hypothetical protein N9L92_05585 [Saprospiraceae bacterium]|nr:hypothetical protein [Saprospiraceae bacterium]